MIITDQLNRTLNISEVPSKIVCLVPSLTELLVDLGLEERIVGVTKFCVHPADLRKKKTVVGGTKQIKPDIIKDLAPDIIIANKEENTPEIIEQLNDIAPIYISDINTIDNCLDLIADFGRIFNVQKSARSLMHSLEEKLNQFKDYIRDKDDVNIAYFIWKEPWMVAGSRTFINCMLELNRFTNVFANVSRYPKIDLEELKDKNLDAVFLSSEPYPFKQEHKDEIKKIVPDVDVEIVDGELFSWYGSRLLKSFDYFRKLRAKLK